MAGSGCRSVGRSQRAELGRSRATTGRNARTHHLPRRIGAPSPAARAPVRPQPALATPPPLARSPEPHARAVRSRRCSPAPVGAVGHRLPIARGPCEGVAVCGSRCSLLSCSDYTLLGSPSQHWARCPPARPCCALSPRASAAPRARGLPHCPPCAAPCVPPVVRPRAALTHWVPAPYVPRPTTRPTHPPPCASSLPCPPSRADAPTLPPANPHARRLWSPIRTRPP